MPDDFPAYLATAKGARAEATRLTRDRLPTGEVLVAVGWSSLNYKDGLALTAKAPVLRAFPIVPGIDLAGTVVESASGDFKPGDEVIATGSGLGESIWGGYAGFARVPAEILVRPPKELGLRRAMAFGTAGLTAMLSVMALERAGLPPKSAVAVTGAGGGVGGVAILILSRLGHRVTAVTGRASEEAYLRGLGAAELSPRDQLAITPEKSLLAERWAGAVDAVGGPLLAGLLRSITTGGAIAVSGMAAGGQLPATVYPFILRGVSLIGIASSVTPMPLRREAWARLARDVPAAAIDAMVREAAFADLPSLADQLMAGTIRGRYVVKVG
jgi:acrylyl-CoA reductase (NADPH)